VTEAPTPLPTPAAVPASPGSAGIVGGVGGLGAVLYAADQILKANGVTGGDMMRELGPVLAPLWGNSWLLVLIIVIAYLAFRLWKVGQATRAAEAAAQRADAAEQKAAIVGLTGKVDDVAHGLTGLRSEVHAVAGRLQSHAESTDEKFAALGGEVSAVRARVDVLERPKPRTRAR